MTDRAAPENTTPPTDAPSAAAYYASRGWASVPIEPGEKRPPKRFKGWDQRTTADVDAKDYRGREIGILLGEPSGGLVDVDLDCPEAIVVARYLLPPTQAVHGRPSAPGSHGWYIVEAPPETARYQAPDRGTLVELRSTGGQTVAPPSTHESGEAIAWVRWPPEPAEVGADELARSVAEVAAAALLACVHPGDGMRHDYALAVAGMLAHAGYPQERTERIVEAISRAAGDRSTRDRVKGARDSYARVHGHPRGVAGAPTLARMVGDDAVSLVRDWLGLRSAETSFASFASFARERPWPELEEAALHGLAGDVVRTIAPETEADPVALLVQYLAAVGSAIGAGPYIRAEADRHPARLYVALVGQTSKGRKGSSWGHIRRIMAQADPVWAHGGDDPDHGGCIASGLSSGEGLIHTVRDPGSREGDEGVTDKRLLVIEGELATALKVANRQGNTLSAQLRQAWDTGDLRVLTRRDPMRATGAHISIIGHITRDELLRELTETEGANGYANRYLWLCVRRSQLLPEGGRVEPSALDGLAIRTREAIEHARSLGERELRRDDDARRIWIAAYPELSAEVPGMLGAVTGRAEAQTMRLALLYALLDGATEIRAEHLTAALALWEYAFASAGYIWGDASGDPTADTIIGALRQTSEGLTRTEISKLFGRHTPSGEIERVLRALAEGGRARAERVQTSGRPTERWYAMEVQ